MAIFQKLLRNSPIAVTLFELASVSKLFTTATFQILCDGNIVKPNDKIGDFLNSRLTLPPDVKGVTLIQLATHTSGFPNLPDILLNKMKDTLNPYNDLKTEDIYEYLQTCTDKKKAGDLEYSNFGLGLLGHLLALKAETDFETLVKQTLLVPLKMNQTTITGYNTLPVKIAHGYNKYGKPNPVWTDTVLTGAGSFLSNTHDMTLFIQAHLFDNSAVSPSLKKTLIQTKTANGIGWIFPDWFDKLMGLKNMLWHNGMAGGYASFISIDTVLKNGVIVLSNKADDITDLGHSLTRTVNTQSWK